MTDEDTEVHSVSENNQAAIPWALLVFIKFLSLALLELSSQFKEQPSAEGTSICWTANSNKFPQFLKGFKRYMLKHETQHVFKWCI